MSILRMLAAAASLVLASPLAAQRAATTTAAGGYVLATVNGHALPARDAHAVNDTHTMRVQVESGLATLHPDGRFSARVTYRFWWDVAGDANTWIPASEAAITGRYVVDAARGLVTFLPDPKSARRAPRPYYGTLRRDGTIAMVLRYTGRVVAPREIAVVVRRAGTRRA